MKIKLTLDRETKGTNVYKDDNPEAPIPQLYIWKPAFGKKDPPKMITLEIKEL